MWALGSIMIDRGPLARRIEAPAAVLLQTEYDLPLRLPDDIRLFRICFNKTRRTRVILSNQYRQTPESARKLAWSPVQVNVKMVT